MLVSANIFQPLISVFASVIEFFRSNVGLSWGWSIILLTICVRLVLIPPSPVLAIPIAWPIISQSRPRSSATPSLRSPAHSSPGKARSTRGGSTMPSSRRSTGSSPTAAGPRTNHQRRLVRHLDRLDKTIAELGTNLAHRDQELISHAHQHSAYDHTRPALVVTPPRRGRLSCSQAAQAWQRCRPGCSMRSMSARSRPT
jgi:hypothetical protein